MKNSNENNKFSKFYLFVAEAKTTFALFYTYMVFMYLLLAKLASAPVQVLSFAMAMQIMGLCLLIGFAQRILIPQAGITLFKSVVWAIISVGASVGAAFVFGWFKNFPFWCALIFYGVLVLGLFMMILHLHIKLNTETKMLNEQLQKFKFNAGEKKGNDA